MSIYVLETEPVCAAAADADLFVLRDASTGQISSITGALLHQYMGGGVVSVTDAASYTVLAANSGKTHFVPDLTQDAVFALPTPAAGLRYEFIYAGVAADAHDWAIDTGSNTNFFLGGVAHLDTDAGSAGDEVVPVAGNGSSNSILNVLVPDVGTRVLVVCDGTNWVVSGQVVGATAPTYADQA